MYSSISLTHTHTHTPRAFQRSCPHLTPQLVIEFEGGGACWNALTCATPIWTQVSKLRQGRVFACAMTLTDACILLQTVNVAGQLASLNGKLAGETTFGEEGGAK